MKTPMHYHYFLFFFFNFPFNFLSPHLRLPAPS